MKIINLTLLLTFLILISFQEHSFAKPIKFAGLDWSMSRSEIDNVMNEKGYKCSQDGADYACKNNQSDIRISDSVIVFNCQSFEGCKANLKFLSKQVSSKFSIFMNYMPLRRQLQMPHYCGDGEDGEKICLLDFSFWGKGVSVLLYKGSFGSKPKFK